METMIEQEKMVVKVEREAKDTTAEVQIISAEIPADGYYRDRIKALQCENMELRAELAKKEKELNQINHFMKVTENNRERAMVARELEVNRELAEKDARISKLEKALVEATIR